MLRKEENAKVGDGESTQTLRMLGIIKGQAKQETIKPNCYQSKLSM